MHEAKTRLSEIVKAVEERNETVVLCRDGHEVAEIGTSDAQIPQYPDVTTVWS